MKKFMAMLFNFIEYKYLEVFSLVIMLIWCIAPVVEYFLKYYFHFGETAYFSYAIYFVGGLGILEYAVFMAKKIHEEGFVLKKYIPFLLIISLLYIALLSSCSSKNISLSFFGDNYRKEGFFVYVMYIGFILACSIIQNKKYFLIILKVIIFSALFITILPLFTKNFVYYGFTNIYKNINHYGYFIMLSLVASLMMVLNVTKYKKIFYFIAYIFLLYILILNNTFGCYLAVLITLFFTLMYSLIKKVKRLEVVILVMAFVLTSFVTSQFDIRLGEKKTTNNYQNITANNFNTLSSDVKGIFSNDNQAGSGRWLLWKEAFNYTLAHPLLGGGMECMANYYRSLNINYNDRPHNVLLQFSSFIGIPGAIIYLCLILFLAFKNLLLIKNKMVNFMIYAMAMCYFISSMVGNSMYYTSPYFMILLGFLISFYQGSLKKNDN